MNADFVMLEETASKTPGEWELYLQYGRYEYSNGNFQGGYRFVCKNPDGRISARGGARLPSLAVAENFIAEARSKGWGDRQHHGINC
jgi:hypothetical protein